ncbi:MAG: hydantoinase/oxoprolinase family protein [Syntrophomonadaceae bacterium]
MLVGIDVGGTFTDGIIMENGLVLASSKEPTDEENLKNSLLKVLDNLLKEVLPEQIKRVVLSTTLVTNVLATGQGERTALVLMPGHGLPHDSYDICPDLYFLSGSIDFRGKEIEPPVRQEMADVAEKLKASGIKKIAVAGKFSNRNNQHERIVASFLREKIPQAEVFKSSDISGKLNFLRRATTAYYTAMTSEKWNRFVDEIAEAIRFRGIKGEIHILKADGGTIPLEFSRNRPCETIFSGPAASTMGGLALSGGNHNSVVIDIGGTTTDIALIIGGNPLYASKGAHIQNHYTHINSFAVRSVALGGDSEIWWEGENLKIGPQRLGVAACFGGECATLTDAFNHYLDLNLGRPEASEAALGRLVAQAGIRDLSKKAVDQAVSQLVSLIVDMFREWENEPAYRVWEVVNKRKFKVDQIIGIGAAAAHIVPRVAQAMGVDYFLHEYSPLANALGAAVVRPTLAVDLHVDTEKNLFTKSPGGVQGQLENRHRLQLEDVKKLAWQHLQEVSRERNMEEYAGDYSYYLEEQFNVIRGWERSGKIFDVGIQIAPGFIKEFEGVKI